jgi:hypothetical protein
MAEDDAKMYEWFDRFGFTVDRGALAVNSAMSPFRASSRGELQEWNALVQRALRARVGIGKRPC